MPRFRVRIRTLLLCIVIAALAMALMVQERRARWREVEMEGRLAQLEAEVARARADALVQAARVELTKAEFQRVMAGAEKGSSRSERTEGLPDNAQPAGNAPAEPNGKEGEGKNSRLGSDG
ncbi:MAG TPA: hypothetical protein VGZ22_16695 [Isosphaeraceae bacterium]|jgi:cell division septum initiation protein DivIVA|nr:hypothetical protein [Isosphaeraceae bacterium]